MKDNFRIILALALAALISISTAHADNQGMRMSGRTTNAGSGGGTPAGSSGDFQTNNAGAFGAFTPGAGIQTFLTTPSSANLRGAMTDETGTGLAYFQGGDIGTPSAGVATNFTGTAAGLTAGTVTTNANLTGDVTSSGNASTIALSVAHNWTGQQNFGSVTTNSSSNLTAWNLATAQNAKQTMTENTTLSNPSNMVDGGVYQFAFTQHASSAKTLAFGSNYIFAGDSTVNTTLSSVTIYSCISDGTKMRCVMSTWAS